MFCSTNLADVKPASIQRVITLALIVLDKAAYASRTELVNTDDVRLALAALWCVLKNRAGLLHYWERAHTIQQFTGEPTCRDSYHLILKHLRDEGWGAPV
jgi:hypothetical protein